MLTLKSFNQDRFFKPYRHPEAQRFGLADYRQRVDRLNLQSTAAPALPLELSDVRNDDGHLEAPNAYTGGKPPDTLKTETNAGPSDAQPSMPRAGPAPATAATAAALDAPEPPSIPFDADGYRMMLIPFFSFGFSLLTERSGINFNLTKSESAELADAAIPVLRKYVRGGFVYAEEVAFVTTLAGIYTRKKIAGAKMETEKGLTPGAEVFTKKAFGGLQGILAMIDPNKVEPIPLDDLTFKKLRDLGERMGLKNINRTEAGRLASVFTQLGLPVDMVEQAVGQLDPEQVRQMADAMRGEQ